MTLKNWVSKCSYKGLIFVFLFNLVWVSACASPNLPTIITVTKTISPSTISLPTTSAPLTTISPPTTSAIDTATTSITKIKFALDYFGIKNTHWISQIGGSSTAQIELVVILSDDTGILATWPPNPESQTFSIDFFQVIALKNYLGGSPIFYSGSVIGPLSLRVVASNVSKGSITKSQIDFLKTFGGGDLTALKVLIPDKELIGTFWQTWLPNSNWGIGSQFTNIISQDDNDLKVWGSIGNLVKEPIPVQQPTLKPNLKIESVMLPTNARKRQASEVYSYNVYYTTFKLVNKESVGVTVNWQANSSLTGNFDSGQVTVPARGYQDIKKGYYFTKSGIETLTYTVSYKGDPLDTWVGTQNILP